MWFLVSAFKEDEVDSFFKAFQRLVAALKWPIGIWSVLLQIRLHKYMAKPWKLCLHFLWMIALTIIK